MKTFKHKKTGEIATYKDGVLKSSGFCVEIGTEPSSEFWEEVIEKNYEILKISGYTLRDNGKYSHHKSQSKIGVITAEKLLSSDRYSYYIKTVKRLSDGEIFTVGDKTLNGDIIEFKLINNILIPTVGKKTPLTANLEFLKKYSK